jgi:uncharacterized protein YqiB (DUF1249 family)
VLFAYSSTREAKLGAEPTSAQPEISNEKKKTQYMLRNRREKYQRDRKLLVATRIHGGSSLNMASVESVVTFVKHCKTYASGILICVSSSTSTMSLRHRLRVRFYHDFAFLSHSFPSSSFCRLVHQILPIQNTRQAYSWHYKRLVCWRMLLCCQSRHGVSLLLL